MQTILRMKEIFFSFSWLWRN